MHQTKVLLFVAAVFPYALLLDQREEVVNYQENLDNWAVMTAIRHAVIPDEDA